MKMGPILLIGLIIYGQVSGYSVFGKIIFGPAKFVMDAFLGL
jgi:hypothetical protein